jgi:hypothetical protein
VCFKGLLDEAMFSEELLYEECVFWMFSKKLCIYRPLIDWQFYIYIAKLIVIPYFLQCCMLLYKHCEPAPDWPRLCALIVDWLS